MDKQIKDEVKTADSLMGMINILNHHYDLEKPLGSLTKKFVVAGLDKLITRLQLKERSKWQKQ